MTHDFDWIVVGSGFGGSVSALRLTEKGYSVGVLECGHRYRDQDFAKSAWNLRRYFWAPKLGLKGILRMTLFKDLFIVSGCGVGGGSLGFANTLYQPKPGSRFYSDPQWAGLDDWHATLDPHYRRAERMLGVTTYEGEGPGDLLLREIADELQVGASYQRTRVGVFFGEPGKTVPDPYFGGEGPERAGCIRCGSCMIGCRHNAKNTLVKNYLWFAERNGARVMPERTVVEIRPLGREDGSDGYAVTSERSGAWLRRDEQTLTASGVVLAAGAIGTNKLLARTKLSGSLPRVSDRLGHLVRTNSEAVLAVTAKDAGYDFSKETIAITSSIYPKADTHIETFTYGPGADAMSGMMTLLTPEGTRLTRPLKLIGQILRRPLDFLRTLWPFGWSRRSILLLVMQTIDYRLRFRPWRPAPGLRVQLQTEQDTERPNPGYIEQAHDAARRIARRIDGVALGAMGESVIDVPLTAHILGGAVIGADARTGVIDKHCRVFDYENLLVCDGSALPANPGVNPSLTIATLAEHAMSQVPAKPGAPEMRKVHVVAPPTQPSPTAAMPPAALL